MESYLYRIPPEQGPRVTVIGGGTGLSTLLRGLKLYTKNLTAVVTVADDGGGSGVLRHDLGMLPPGDVRSCLEALANTEPLMQRLMHYRFTEGTLAGQSFGNLFLAALSEILPSFDQAVESLSQILAITGRVLPVTNENVRLEAELENGARVAGESSICGCKRVPHPPRPSASRWGAGAARCARGHPRGRYGRPRAGEPLYQHHPESPRRRRRGGDHGLRRAEGLCLQRHDAGGGDGGLYRGGSHPRAV